MKKFKYQIVVAHDFSYYYTGRVMSRHVTHKAAERALKCYPAATQTFLKIEAIKNEKV